MNSVLLHNLFLGLAYSPLTEHLFCTFGAVGSIPDTAKTKAQENILISKDCSL